TVCRFRARRTVSNCLRIHGARRHFDSSQPASSSSAEISGVNPRRLARALPIAILLLTVIAPFAVPGIQVQLTIMWIMIVFALSWDILGGQMGYNSFGNIAFFGIGGYTATIVQIGLSPDVAADTA